MKHLHTFESFLYEGFRRPDKEIKIADPYKTVVEQYLDDRNSKELNRIIISQKGLTKQNELFLNKSESVNNMIVALKNLDKSKDAYELVVDDQHKIEKSTDEKDSILIKWTKGIYNNTYVKIQLENVDDLIKALEKLVKL